MEIIHKRAEGGGTFAAVDADNSIGEMTYHMESSELMSIDHTEVKSKERGNNIGIKLLDFASDYARSKQLKIKPLCAYVNAMFQRYNDKYKDVMLNQSI